MLTVLEEHRDKVVPRERLMAEVWPANWFGSTKTLDVTIGRLRNKLQEAGLPDRVWPSAGWGSGWSTPGTPTDLPRVRGTDLGRDMDDAVLASLEAAVAARPDDVPLRLHLAELLLDAGRTSDAVRHARPRSPPTPTRPTRGRCSAARWATSRGTRRVRLGRGGGRPRRGRAADVRRRRRRDRPRPPAFDVERAGVTPGRRRRHGRGQEAPGAGVPRRRCATPSCARCTARACAAGCCSTARRGAARRSWPGPSPARWGAGSSRVSLADVLDMWIGNSERNLHELFEAARAQRALRAVPRRDRRARPQAHALTRPGDAHHGQPAAHRARRRRRRQRGRVRARPRPTTRGTSTRRCAGPAGSTGPCWSCRPTPRPAARSSSTTCATGRSPASTCASWPSATEGFSGADLAHLCETAAEIALMDSARRTGTVRMIGEADIEAALREVRPSIGPGSRRPATSPCSPTRAGEYDELAEYLRKRGLG